MKIVQILILFLLANNANADYVDIVNKNDVATIKTRFNFNGVILDAEKSEVDKIGVGYGFRQKQLEFNLGIGADTKDNTYTFVGLFYDADRDGLLSIEFNSSENNSFIFGYAYPLARRSGLLIEVDSLHGDITAGVRAWF